MVNSPNLSDTKRALLEKYLRGNAAQNVATAPVIPRHNLDSHIPLSFGQQQLWLLAQLIPDTPVYNESVTIRIPGPLDAATLECSLNEFIRRHEICRTTFPVIDGMPVQFIHPSLTLALPLIDLRSLPKDEREAEAHRLMQETASRLFDLSTGPLLRALLLRMSKEESRLFLSLHHILFDGVALYQVLLPELSAIYDAFAAGRPSPLSEPTLQYADYACWQREWLQADRIAAHLDYWKQQLAGSPTELALPTDRPRPAIQSYRGAMHRFTLSKILTGTLKTISQQHGVTFYMTLIAAFQALLHRYTGQDDLLIGTASAGRQRPEVQHMMGFFLNTLVLRADLSGNPTFRELLGRVRDVTLEAMAHQDVPFEYVVKELQPERTRNTNPLFQALLTLVPPQPILASGWTLTQMDVEVGAAKFDLYLELDDTPGGLDGRFMYNTDLFDASTIERMAQHWRILLAGIARDPDARIADLPIMTPQEQQQLHEWNRTATDYPRDTCVYRLFEEQVERVPDNVALVCEDQQMTYRELNRRANQLAHRLRKLGVGRETLVGLYMDRSFELIVSLLGILKAGGAYVPLDPAYPKERLAFMLQDTLALVLLAQTGIVDTLPDTQARIVCLDATWEAIDAECAENLDNCASAENLAYVMYTSGSTGRPKGTEIRHLSINRLVFGTHYAQLDASQTILHMASISFDAATLEVWGALLHGARCVIFPERVPTPQSIGALARKHSVTLAWLTASLFNAVIDEAPQALAGIRHILTGGEALSVTHIRRALQELPATQLTNGYGPTESTTFTTCYPIPRRLDETLRSIPIGKPIGNTQVYILDKHLRQVPTGIAGELHIGGDGLARGYFHRPELTAEKFIDHPFSDEPGAKLYKTGDLARYLPDGNIEFLGRRDSQVKIRGFRVEPGEVEALLNQYATTREAVVIVKENARGEKCLVTYVVPQEGQRITVSELRTYLKQQLPDYMMPSDIVLLDALPITPNGKLDQRALPEPEPLNRLEEDTFAPPTQILHYQLLAIWEDLLQVRPIGIRDNFFDLGGHSLLAARLVARIEEVCGRRLSLTTLFAGPTIEQVAEALSREEGPRPRTPLVAVQVGKARQSFFFLHGDPTGGAFYCFQLARRLGAEYSFYVLEPYRFDDLPVPPSIETMASAHIEALQAVQPEGPYLLGGWCNGGLMAYEMAQQLQARGQVVEMLILLDPAVVSPFSRLLHGLIRWSNRWLHLSEEQQVNSFLRLFHLYESVRLMPRRAREAEYLKRVAGDQAAKGQPVFPTFKTMFPPAATLHQSYRDLYNWASLEYAPGPYAGKTTIVWAREEPLKGLWQRKAASEAQIELYFTPGNHMTCRTEHLGELADLLAACIHGRDASSSTGVASGFHL